MAALRDYPPLRLVPPPMDRTPLACPPVARPPLARMIVAVLLLTAMGVLAAASVFASRPYQHASAPAPGKYQPLSTTGPTPDPC